MNKITPIILIALLFFGCQFNQSIESDLNTGAYSRGDGLGVGDITIEINETITNTNNFTYGDKVNFVFNDIQGLTKVDGKSFPEMSLHVIKNDTDTIISNPNLLKHITAGTDLKPLKLIAFFSAVLPPKSQEEYKVLIEISDKKGKGTFNYELPFTIIETEVLNITSNNLEYTTIYLWDETEKQVVKKNKIDASHTYILIIEGIQGFEQTDGNVYPILAIDLKDNNENVILYDPNIFKMYESVGVNAELVKKQVTATFSFPEGIAPNTCQFSAVLKDKNSSKQISVTADLEML